MILAHRLTSGPDPFGQKPRHGQPEPNQIWPGFPLVLWKNATESKSRLVAFCRKLGPVILAHRLAFGRDAFGQILTRPSSSEPSQFCTWSRPLEEPNGSTPDAGCMLAITEMLLDQIWHVYWVCFRHCSLANPSVTLPKGSSLCLPM